MAEGWPYWGVYRVRVERAALRPGGRLLAVSDIHGHAALLDALLARLSLRPGDTLVFVGDYIERGTESLAAVRRVMELCASRPGTYALLGNIDAHKVWEIDTPSPVNDEDLLGNITRFGGSLFGDMCRELGMPCATVEEIAAARGPVREAFGPTLAFLRGLPTILETEPCTFVHGGLPADDLASLEGTEFFACAKFDRFAERTAPLRKPTVVGHWPSCLYRRGRSDGSPYWWPEKNVLSIDGGCGLRYDAQLNAVEIDPAAPCGYRWTATSRFSQVVALAPQEGRPCRGWFCWPRSRGHIMGRAGGVTLVEQGDTGLTVEVPDPFVEEEEGGVYVNDCTDEELAVSPGDLLWLIAETKRGAYVRKDGVSGWYRGPYESRPPREEPWHGGVPGR